MAWETGTRDRAIGARLLVLLCSVLRLLGGGTKQVHVAGGQCWRALNGLLAATPPRDKGQAPPIPLIGAKSP